MTKIKKKQSVVNKFTLSDRDTVHYGTAKQKFGMLNPSQIIEAPIPLSVSMTNSIGMLEPFGSKNVNATVACLSLTIPEITRHAP